VLTKRDLVEPAWAEMVARDARALLAGTVLANAPVVEFSATTGAGAAELLAALDRQLGGLANRSVEEPARLPVDRVFTVEGVGTVGTGTLWRGRVRPGDAMELVPASRPVRVRRVQVHGVTVEEARAGQRSAVALHGVEREQVERGHWLIAPGSLRESNVLDARFELLPDYPRAGPANPRVRFPLGESEAAVGAALAPLVAGGELVSPVAGRWLSSPRWGAAREAIAREVGEYAARHPARYGIPKGELKSGLKSALDAALFDAAFESLAAGGALEQRAERVRPAGEPWAPPADTLAALEKLAGELEAAGLAVPEAAAWRAKLGAAAAEIEALGSFLGRLVRVSQDFTCTARQP